MKNFAIFFHSNSHKIFFWLFMGAFLLQFLFWQRTHDIKPNYHLVPDVPSKMALKIYSLGDSEFLYRILSMRIQNAGDIFAGFVPLKYYDYDKVYGWFMALDDLNPVANFTPALASYIYSNIKDDKKLRLMVKYLKNHGKRDLDKNWWWLFQAIYHASNVLGDNEEALEIAEILSQNTDKAAPLWTRQMPAFIHAKKGDDCAAFAVIEAIINEANSEKTKVTAQEMDFMRYFIKTRLKSLKNSNFRAQKCKK